MIGKKLTWHQIKETFKMPEGTHTLVQGDVKDDGSGYTIQFIVFETMEQRYCMVMRAWNHGLEQRPQILVAAKPVQTEEFNDQWIKEEEMEDGGYNCYFTTSGQLINWAWPPWEIPENCWNDAYRSLYTKVKEYFK